MTKLRQNKKQTKKQIKGESRKAYPFWMYAVFFLILWEGGARFGGISPLLLPDVGTVMQALLRDLTKGDLAGQAALSVGVIVLALLVSLVLAILLRIGADYFAVLEGLLDFLTALAHPLPGLALLPLIILWFGVGSGAVFVILIHSALWPMLLNLESGLQRTPEAYIDTARSLSMNKIQILLEIRLRYAFPELLSGLKIGWARAWRALISAEMVFGALGESGGLGTYLLNKRTFMDTAGLFAGMLVIVLIGLFVERVLFLTIEKHTVEKWGMQT